MISLNDSVFRRMRTPLGVDAASLALAIGDRRSVASRGASHSASPYGRHTVRGRLHGTGFHVPDAIGHVLFHSRGGRCGGHASSSTGQTTVEAPVAWGRRGPAVRRVSLPPMTLHFSRCREFTGRVPAIASPMIPPRFRKHDRW